MRPCVVDVFYDTVLDDLLEAIDWSFARKDTGAMALLSETDADGVQPVQGWDYLYSKPSGCIKVREVFEDGGAMVSEYVRSESQNFEELANPTNGVACIASNIEDAYGKYTFRVTDTSQYPGYFRKALASALAEAIVMPLTQKDSLLNAMTAAAFKALSEAARKNGGRDNKPAPKTSKYIEAR